MKSLIIAEKSSLAKNIADAIKYKGEEISKVQKGNGIIYESESYVIVSARGHLFELYDIEDYTGIKEWNCVNLPFFPEKFKFKPISDAQEYITNIKEQLSRKDIINIVNAGDAGREGEYLIRLILMNLNNKKPVLRLWMPSQTPEAISEALTNMKSDSEFDGLFNEGLARSVSDWLDGINYTRYVTLKSGNFLRVGRVISTIVRIIKQRDDEIKSFKSETYYNLESDTQVIGTKLHMVYDLDFEAEEKPDAIRMAKYLNEVNGKVIDIKKTEKVIPSPKLFSLSKLQNYMNNYHSWPGDKTLAILEELYLAKYVTYPRTNSEYLSDKEKNQVARIIGRFKQRGFDVIEKPDDKIFDDSKIEDHGAIIPELNFPKEGTLNDNQRLLYDCVKNRFLAYFCKEKRVIEETHITIGFEGVDEIEIKGHIVKSEGWKKYDSAKTENNIILPNLQLGDILKADFKVIEKKTSPKKFYTVETLNNYLENPLRTIKGSTEEAEEEAYKNLLEGCNIGTPASLSGIITKAIKDGFIELSGKNYKILPKGIYLCDTLDALKISMDVNKTIELNKNLKLINDGKFTVKNYIGNIRDDIIKTLEKSKSIQLEKYSETKVIGACPRCKSKVIEGNKTYHCENCKFVLFKEDLFWTSKHKRLSESMAKAFLEGKKVKMKDLYSESKKSNYEATVKMVDDGTKISFKLEFENSKKKA